MKQPTLEIEVSFPCFGMSKFLWDLSVVGILRNES